MFRWIKSNPFAFAGLVLYAVIVGNFVKDFGSKWTFGPRYAMPRSLVSPDDPWLYADGSKIDPLTRALIKADREEEVFGCFFVLFIGCWAWIAVDVTLFHRRRNRFLREIARRSCKCPPKPTTSR